jgi:hypothetical protein
MPGRLVLINLLILILSAISPVFALTLEFTNPPSSIDQNQEFSVDINLSCSSCGDSYLRGVFFPSGSNYFGYTKNNKGDWINFPASQAVSYFAVLKDEVKEGSWSGKLVVKPDPSDSAYIGPGLYNFKVGRLTSSGSVTWSNPVLITITGPTPTLVPPTSKPTEKPTPISTIVIPTPTYTPVPTSKPTSVVIPTHTFVPDQVLSASVSSDIIKTPSLPKFPLPAIILIIIGIGIIISAVILKI